MRVKKKRKGFEVEVFEKPRISRSMPKRAYLNSYCSSEFHALVCSMALQDHETTNKKEIFER